MKGINLHGFLEIIGHFEYFYQRFHNRVLISKKIMFSSDKNALGLKNVFLISAYRPGQLNGPCRDRTRTEWSNLKRNMGFFDDIQGE